MSWVPWLIQLNAVINRTRKTKRRTMVGLSMTCRTLVRCWCSRCRVASHTCDSRTRLRTYRLITAGMMDRPNSQRQDSPATECTSR